MSKPVLVGEDENETRGVEDPRIVWLDGRVYVYYGGADRSIGLATASLEELLAFVMP